MRMRSARKASATQEVTNVTKVSPEVAAGTAQEQEVRFRKKPVVIEAVRYAGKGNLEPRGGLPNWLWAALESGVARFINGGDPLLLRTLEGELTVSPGDWIIRGVKGELYPCKPDIFEATYERAALPSAPALPQTPRTEAVWLWDAEKDGYWHQGEFVSADQLRWLLRRWPAAPAPPEALLDLVVRLQREEHERACGMRLVFASKGPCKTGWHFTPEGEPQRFEECQHPDCVLVRRWTPAQPVCPTCGGRGWVTVSQVNFTPDPVMGSGGSWNEPCPQCRPSASAFPETPQP
jgi:hypothetical protein